MLKGRHMVYHHPSSSNALRAPPPPHVSSTASAPAVVAAHHRHRSAPTGLFPCGGFRSKASFFVCSVVLLVIALIVFATVFGALFPHDFNKKSFLDSFDREPQRAGNILDPVHVRVVDRRHGGSVDDVAVRPAVSLLARVEGEQVQPPMANGVAARPPSMSLACVAAHPSKEQPSLYDFTFYRRFYQNPPRTNLALLTREARFIPELSPSPLIAAYMSQHNNNQRGGDAQEEDSQKDSIHENAAMEWLQRTLSESPCRIRRANPRVVLVTVCRDQPKRAWEHVAYHMLLGVHRVVMLDASSNARPGLPTVQSYLKPWLHMPLDASHSGSVMLEIVPAAQYLRTATTSGGTKPQRHDDAFVDADDAQRASSTFVKDAVRKIRAQEANDTIVLVLEDVNDFVLITAAAQQQETRQQSEVGAANVSTHADVVCLHDVVSSSMERYQSASSSSIRRRRDSEAQHPSTTPLMTIMKTLVATEALYDNSRTPFEMSLFAAGDTLRMVRDAAMFVRQRRSEMVTVEEVPKIVEHFGLLGSPAAVADSKRPHSSSKEEEEHRPGGPLVFPDGTSWTELAAASDPAAPFRSTSTASLLLRVIRIAETRQEAMERAIISCYISSSKHKSATSATFDSSRVRPVRPPTLDGAMTDDLPAANSLKRNGFLALHKLLLKAMKYPPQNGARRERTIAQMGVTVVPQIQELLSRYVVYGNSNNNNLGEDRSSLSFSRAAAHDITNENLVSGYVRLLPEPPLIPQLNTTHLDVTLTTLFKYHLRGEEGRTADRTVCPSLHAAASTTPLHAAKASPQSSSSRHLPSQPNVTFCVVVRNRAKLTLEWILYHKLLGVGRFIVVDDGSTDSLSAILQPLVDRGMVMIIDADDGTGIYRFRGRHVVRGPLLAGYGQCIDLELDRAKRESHASAPWVGLLDSDEFLVLPTGECVPEIVGRVVASRSSSSSVVGAIAFSWRNIAPLNNDIFDASPTQFHRTGFSCGTSDRIQRVKVLVDASLARTMDTAHRVGLASGAVTIFPNGKSIPGPGWYTGANADTEAQGVIFHYHARSLTSWMQRFLDGFADNDNHHWMFDINTYFGRWFADTAKTVTRADKVWLESIPGWKERLAIVEALLTGQEPPLFVRSSGRSG